MGLELKEIKCSTLFSAVLLVTHVHKETGIFIVNASDDVGLSSPTRQTQKASLKSFLLLLKMNPTPTSCALQS